MDAAARRPLPSLTSRAPLTSRAALAILATLAVLLITAASVGVALATPGSLDLVASGPPGQARVTWVAPDGPAWNAGVLPGATLVDGRLAVATTHGESVLVSLAAAATTPPTAFLLTALGLALAALGLLVFIRSADRVAAGAFWRMSLLVGATLACCRRATTMRGGPWR